MQAEVEPRPRALIAYEKGATLMKKLLTFAAVSALIALGSVSWASTNLHSLKSGINRLALDNEGVSSSQPTAMAAQSIKAGQASKPAAQTIVICKKTIPSGGTGFPFSWANGSGPLPPFTMNDGQCTTKNMTGQDHYNKFTENVPAGWTLTNISCTHTTTPLQIIGANPNSAFQPGDNTVTMDLNEANVTCTFVNQAVKIVDPCCPPWNQDVLKDMLFYQGSGSISAPYTLKFQPTTVFLNQMQAYINYLYSINSALTGITIDWRLHDQGTGTLPTPPYGPQVNPTAYATWTWNNTGIGNPVLNPGSFFSPASMQVGTWYMVHTGIYLENGQSFFPKKCGDNEIYVRIQVMNAAKGSRGPVLEFSDGKKVVKSVPLSESNRQQR
jgi:hypothetical protein